MSTNLFSYLVTFLGHGIREKIGVGIFLIGTWKARIGAVIVLCLSTHPLPLHGNFKSECQA